MCHYVGLDVSTKEIFICILNEKGTIVFETTEVCCPEAVGGKLRSTGLEIEHIGLESGSVTHWLTKGLRSQGYKVTPMESRKMAAILATLINKTDKNDARGIAEALRVGHYREVTHRSDQAMQERTLLHCRDTLVRERTHLLNSIRGHLKVYGVKNLGSYRAKFKTLLKEALSRLDETIQFSITRMLNVLDNLEQEIDAIEKKIREYIRGNEDIQLLKTVDGVGDIVALAFRSEIDDPQRFKKSRDVAAYLGLTPSQYSSGETKRQGSISKKGSKHARYLLVEAATVLLTRCKRWSKLKAWGMKLSKKKGKKKAIVAVARKLAVIMHRMLITRKKFEPTDSKERETQAIAA
jgi:transposase